MPLPFIIAGIAVAAATGVGAGAAGHSKKKKANELLENAKAKYDSSKNDFEKANILVEKDLENLGKLELQIGTDFEKFDKLIQDIMQNNNFKTYSGIKIDIPKHQLAQIKEVALRATDYLGVVAGGVVGGMAASGFVTSMVVAFGAASTGTAISSLAGVAATNATLAAIGGGSLAAGGLGIAGGTAILGGVAAAPLVAVAGVAYAFHGAKALSNAEATEIEVNDIVEKMHKAKVQFGQVQSYVKEIYDALTLINMEFQKYFATLKTMNEIIKNGDKEAIKSISEDVTVHIENGLAIAAIMASIISTPLFELKKNNAGNLILNQENQPIIALDENGFQKINKTEILNVVNQQKVKFSAVPKL